MSGDQVVQPTKEGAPGAHPEGHVGPRAESVPRAEIRLSSQRVGAWESGERAGDGRISPLGDGALFSNQQLRAGPLSGPPLACGVTRQSGGTGGGAHLAR